MKRILHRPMAAALSAILMGTPALAGSPTKTFYNPTYQGLPLDYCVNWSRACVPPAVGETLIEGYAASAARGSWFCRTAAGV